MFPNVHLLPTRPQNPPRRQKTLSTNIQQSAQSVHSASEVYIQQSALWKHPFTNPSPGPRVDRRAPTRHPVRGHRDAGRPPGIRPLSLAPPPTVIFNPIMEYRSSSSKFSYVILYLFDNNSVPGYSPRFLPLQLPHFTPPLFQNMFTILVILYLYFFVLAFSTGDELPICSPYISCSSM